MTATDFHPWINQKYIEWRGNSRGTVSEFADYLDISQSTVSAWINGSRGKPETQKIINKLVDKYGDEAYLVLFPSQTENGLPNPKRMLFEKINRMSDAEAEAAIRQLESRK